MKLIYSFIPFILYFSLFCIADALDCEKRKENSGVISYTRYSNTDIQKCWIIEVPQGSYVRFEVQEIKPYGRACTDEYIQIKVAGTEEEYKFCSQDRDRKPITALNDVNITYYNLYTGNTWPYWTTRRQYWTTPQPYRETTDRYWRPSTDRYWRPSTDRYWRPSTDRYWRPSTDRYWRPSTDWYWRPSTDWYWRLSTSLYWYTTPPYAEYYFKLNFTVESLVCAQKNSFRCSEDQCVYENQVCDGVKNCKNGADEKSCETGVAAIKGVTVARKNAIKWLKNHRFSSSGWGRNTHRAITALFLSAGASFQGKNLEEDLIVKQLELQTAVALLRNSSVPLSVNDLSMYINALSVTCHNVRQFYGHDLLHILSERLGEWKSPIPGAYLTLCNANWTLSESHIRRLLDFLYQSSEYPFDLDIQAMTVMALTCVKNKSNVLRDVNNATEVYDATIKKFFSLQKSDGSFGNVYTTALITQALLSSGQGNNKAWNVAASVRHLVFKINSSPNFLSTSLALPIFNGKTFADITSPKCDTSRKQGEDEEISDIVRKFGGKMKNKYSLYIGDQKDMIHSVYLRMPENSSAYDVMKVAQVADPKYKFLDTDASGYRYVYEIGEVTNDPEAGKFWLLYSGYFGVNGTLTHSSESPDKLILQDGQHLVMWYKTAHVRDDEMSKMFRRLFVPATL